MVTLRERGEERRGEKRRRGGETCDDVTDWRQTDVVSLSQFVSSVDGCVRFTAVCLPEFHSNSD